MPEEPCQCSDCLRFYRQHDRLIREFPTLRQQQEVNWAALQSFRTLCGRVLEDLQKKVNLNSSNQIEDKFQNRIIDKNTSNPINNIDNLQTHNDTSP